MIRKAVAPVLVATGEHVQNRVIFKQLSYVTATMPGFSTQIKETTMADYRFPDGPVWAGN